MTVQCRWKGRPIRNSDSGDQLLGTGPGLRSGFRWADLHEELDWLPDGGLNIAHETVDRHANGRKRDKLALIWDGENGEHEEYTFGDLKTLTNRFANVLKSLGIEKGDRVCLYIDRVPELYVAFVGILKIGAIVVPLSTDVEPELLRERLSHCAAKVVITQPELRRRMTRIIYELFELQHIVVVNKDARDPLPVDTADLDYNEEMAKAPAGFEIEATNYLDYSLIHYGGHSRGIVSSHQALIQHLEVGRSLIDLRDDDVYWCTQDPATVEGTACGILAAWANGGTLFTSETDFDPALCYQKIQSRQVTVLCADQADVKMLARGGDDMPGHFDLSSLRHLVSVDGRLAAETVGWSERVLGTPVHDSWCEPETGASILANLPTMEIKPGSSGSPLPGIGVAILDGAYSPVPSGVQGMLAVSPGWPSMFCAYWNATELYNTRFRKGWYITGQQARMDDDGYVWLTADSLKPRSPP